MTVRHTVDSITSDALDALYEQLAAAEAGESQRQLATAREALASATTRAARAEAAIARVRAVAGWAIQGWSDLSPEKVLLAVEGHQPAPAPAATQATEPREHCGHLSPDIGLTTVRTECVLRPGHSGSHADDVGCRWHPITEQEQLMPTDQPTCTATIEGPHVLGGGPITCTREAGHPANHVGSLQGDDGKTMWTDWTAGATPHRPA
ncbi:hypothetical protein NC239_33685 [Streptomyces sp. G3]|uniref:hypothetical protein n=1 Tax=Streptomyces sp. G3 TaxID=690144 RepID=UPI002030C9B5|nr:hypothetical protein [Streptomyces sp. G3]MCM1943166.1 hypothetical protein [Streptomyces sp. G3]